MSRELRLHRRRTRREDDLSVETKTTRDGQSDYEGPPWPSGDADLRICRLGPTFRLYKRAIGDGAWTLGATYARDDLPAALQVGLNIYSIAPRPDLLATFDEVRFAPAAAEADCTR